MQYPKICIKLDKLPKRTSFWPDFVRNVTPVRSSNSFEVYQGLNSSDSSWWICAAHPSTLICFIRVSIDLVWGGNPHWPNLWTACLHISRFLPQLKSHAPPLLIVVVCSEVFGVLGWKALAAPFVVLQGPWRGVWRPIVGKSLVGEPLTLLDNYGPTQTPPPPRFDPSRGELVCLKERLGSLL